MSKRSRPRGGRKSRGTSNARRALPSTPDGGNGGMRRPTDDPADEKPSNGGSNGSGGNGLDQFSVAADTLKGVPEVREELVARYRKIIAEGRYDPDLDGVAERMIREGLLKDV